MDIPSATSESTPCSRIGPVGVCNNCIMNDVAQSYEVVKKSRAISVGLQLAGMPMLVVLHAIVHPEVVAAGR